MRTRLLDILSKRGEEIEKERKCFLRTGREHIHAGPTPRPTPGKSRCSRPWEETTPHQVSQPLLSSEHTQGDEEIRSTGRKMTNHQKKAKFSILAYHLRTTGNTVTPTPPLPEPPQGPRPRPLQSPEDTHCLSQRGSALRRQ